VAVKKIDVAVVAAVVAAAAVVADAAAVAAVAVVAAAVVVVVVVAVVADAGVAGAVAGDGDGVVVVADVVDGVAVMTESGKDDAFDFGSHVQSVVVGEFGFELVVLVVVDAVGFDFELSVVDGIGLWFVDFADDAYGWHFVTLLFDVVDFLAVVVAAAAAAAVAAVAVAAVVAAAVAAAAVVADFDFVLVAGLVYGQPMLQEKSNFYAVTVDNEHILELFLYFEIQLSSELIEYFHQASSEQMLELSVPALQM